LVIKPSQKTRIETNFNPNWVKVGFNSWKSLILKKTIESDEINYGDILFYHDTDIEKYPNYKLNINQWKDTSIEILNHLKSDIFIPSGNPLYKDVKAYAIRKHLKKFSQFNLGVWNGLIILRKSKTSIKFINEWYELCSDLSVISPLPNPDPFPGNIWHSPDQATLGLLVNIWKEKKLLPKNWPIYNEGDRSFGLHIFENNLYTPTFIDKLKFIKRCYTKSQ